MNTTKLTSEVRRTRSASGWRTCDGSSLRKAARTSPDAASASPSESTRSRCSSAARSAAVLTATAPTTTTAITTTASCSSRSWRARLMRPTRQLCLLLRSTGLGSGERGDRLRPAEPLRRGRRLADGGLRHERAQLRVGERRIRERGLEALLIEVAVPPRDHHGVDAVADAVGQRAAFRHHAIDADDERDADGYRLRREERPSERLQGGGERHQPGAGDAGGALRGENHQRGERELLADRHVLAGGLHDEQRAEREVDAGAVEVERVARGQDDADGLARGARALELDQQPREHGLGRGRAEDDQQLVLEQADEAQDR